MLGLYWGMVYFCIVNWSVVEWRRIGSIYGNAGLAARITFKTEKYVPRWTKN